MGRDMAADDDAGGLAVGQPGPLDAAEPAETDSERQFFADAVTKAVAAPEIARVIGDYLSADDVRDFIERRRADIWAAVAAPRARLRDTEQALLAAEKTVRNALLERDDEADWRRQRDELDERWRAAQEYAQAKRNAMERAQQARSTGEVEAMVKDAESAIDQEQARLRAPGADRAPVTIAVPKAAQPERSGLRRDARRQRRPGPEVAADAPEREYEEARAKLDRVRRAYQDFAAAEQRRRDVLEPGIRRAISQDAAWATARRERDEARQLLIDDLFSRGTLPMARAFVNRRAAKLHRTSMRVPEQSGLYDTYTSALAIPTEAIISVADWLGRMKGASIGIAGPRGAGKTTLIEVFCSPQVQDERETARPAGGWVQLRVSAPVEYVPLDFIRYLLGELCRTILRLDAPGELPQAASLPPAEQEPDRARGHRRSDKPLNGRWILAAGLCLAALLAAPVLAEIALLGAAGVLRGAITVTQVAMVLLVAFFTWTQDPWSSPPLAPGPAPRLPFSRAQSSYYYASRAVIIGRRIVFFLALAAVATAVAWPYLRPPPGPVPTAILVALAIALVVAVTVFGGRWRRFGDLPPWWRQIAAAGAVAAIYTDQRMPARPFLLIGGCIAAGVAAAAAFAAGDEPPWPPLATTVLRTSRDILALGALAAFGLSWYPGRLNYVLCVAVGLAALGGIAAALAVIIPSNPDVRLPRATPTDDKPPADEEQVQQQSLRDLTKKAARLLGDMEYAQTLSLDRSLTWSAGLGGQLPLSVEKAKTAGSSWARQPWSVPAAVEQFRDLARQAATLHAGLVVGIDELDKLEYAKSAAFLNDIKAIFGVPGCYFLVSVSENAAAGFERRGVPFRDVFDSSFDEIITVGYLDWQRSRQLLNTRVVGMHAPFAALCYVVSGGLARDLIRTARAVLSQPDDGGNVLLSHAVRKLCRDEMLGKTHGIARELANLADDTYAQSLLAHIQATDESWESAQDYLEWSEYVGGWIHAMVPLDAVDAGRAVRFARELTVFAYFTATVCEFFGEQLSRTRFEKVTAASIDRLARARQMMAVSAVVAERHIVQFRQEFPDWQVPRPLQGATQA